MVISVYDEKNVTEWGYKPGHVRKWEGEKKGKAIEWVGGGRLEEENMIHDISF